MGNFLGEHAERMIDFGNSLEIGLPFFKINWKIGSFLCTLFHLILCKNSSGKLRDFEINLFLETFSKINHVVGEVYLLMFIIRLITQHDYRYLVPLGSRVVNPGAGGLGGGGLEPSPSGALHDWMESQEWGVTVGGPGGLHPKPGGLGCGSWVNPGRGGPPLHACLHTGGLNLDVEIKLASMGHFLVVYAKRMTDFGNSLDCSLPFFTKWTPLGYHDTEQGCSRVTWGTPKVFHSPSGIFFLAVG